MQLPGWPPDQNPTNFMGPSRESRTLRGRAWPCIPGAVVKECWISSKAIALITLGENSNKLSRDSLGDPAHYVAGFGHGFRKLL